MKHLTEEDLIALYYGEPEGDAQGHLRSCRECSARYATLRRDLESIRPASVPARSAQYGEEVWQKLRPSLIPYERPRSLWHNWIHFRVLVGAAACAALLAIAFIGGRYWERHNAKSPQIAANPQTSQRVVLVVLTDHLDRTERLLISLQHADPSDTEENAELQSEARELLASNRLYRTTASDAGDPALAGALDQLERVLAEVANNPNLTSADLARVRQEMNTEGILFEIRVLLSQTPKSASGPNHPKGASV